MHLLLAFQGKINENKYFERSNTLIEIPFIANWYYKIKPRPDMSNEVSNPNFQRGCAPQHSFQPIFATRNRHQTHI